MNKSCNSKHEENDMDRDTVIETLNRILELELAGVVRSMHYSLMVFGRSS